jgi:hypothetical protein
MEIFIEYGELFRMTKVKNLGKNKKIRRKKYKRVVYDREEEKL